MMLATHQWNKPSADLVRLMLWPGLVWLVVMIIMEFVGIDVLITNTFADLYGFPLRQHWFLQDVLHTCGRHGITGISVLMFTVAISSIWLTRLRPWWRPAITAVLAIICSTTTVALLKIPSGVHCPYDLTIYGGDFVYRDWWQAYIPGQPLGKGWPAAHASAGFSLVVFYHLARGRTSQPLWWLVPGLGLGFLFSLSQVLRGAHFPTHSLYSLGICWVWGWAFARWSWPSQEKIDRDRSIVRKTSDISE